MRYDWTVEVDGDDISQWVRASGTIDYGRPTRATRFQAPTAIFDVFTKDENPNPAPAPGTWPDIRLGSVVIIHATWDGVNQSRRFSGVVQALDWRLYGLRVTATGALVDGPDAPSTPPYPAAVDWQTRWAGGTGPIANYPAAAPQLETDRVTWLADQAGYPLEVEGTPARRVRAIPPNSLGQPLLDAVLRVAEDCDALLLQDRLGVMRYRTKNFTRPTRVILPPHLVESTSIDLAFERGTVVNQVTVYYGEPDPATGNQAAVSEQDDDSIIEFGERRTEMYTDIQYEAGARGRATDHLAKSRAAWEAPDVTLLMNQATGAEADAIWELQEDWRVTVSPLPVGCPIASYDGDILGFTEVMHETDYRLILHLGPPFGVEGAPPEVPIFAVDSITGGTVHTYEDQYGYLWQSHTWSTPGSATLTVNESVTVEALVVAGGAPGRAGNLSDRGGGGGAGAVFHGELPWTPGTIPVEVGAESATSKLGDVWCYGGGIGGTPGGGAGGSGGFGGGAGSPYASGGTGLYGSLDGGVTTDTVAILGGPGLASSSPSGAGGGASLVSSIVDGTAVTYAKPGAAQGTNAPGVAGDTPGSGGQGGGNLSNPGGAGTNGIVAVRYRVG